jgi:enolase
LNPQAIDQKMIKLDGTTNKSRLGANAILAVSLAVHRVGAVASKQELFIYLAKQYKFDSKSFVLPTPSFNIWNGGAHASTNLDFQEFMIMPLHQKSFSQSLQQGAEIFHELGKILTDKKMDTDLGNEGGYAPEVKSREEVMNLITLAVKKSGYKMGKDVGLGLDVGSSELYDHKKDSYYLPLDKKYLSAVSLIALYRDWIKKYGIVSIEDGLAENDWENWGKLTKELGKKVLLIGDDLFTTNSNRLLLGLEYGAGNAILIKPNQIGTISETMETIKLAKKNKYRLMISHRSGETTDDFIADLAVAVCAEYIKSGSLARGERLVKYNRLSEIEMIINKQW